MPKFEFTITAPATASASVTVEADTIEEAHKIAVDPAFHSKPENATFELDTRITFQNVYVPEPDNYYEAPIAGPKS